MEVRAMNIRQLRQQQGMTQEELAKRLNVEPPAVSKWERRLAYPRIENLVAMAEIFGCSVGHLLGLEPQKDSA